MTAQTIAAPPPARASRAGALQRLSTWLYRHPRLALAILLAPPLAWLGIVYLGSLLALLAQSFFYLDGFTGLIVREFSLRTYAELFTGANLDIILRTTVMATVVTLACGLIGFPIAYYMARYAGPRLKPLMYLGVMLPLWSSYLVRVYSWKLILAKEGIVGWVFHAVGLQGVLDSLASSRARPTWSSTTLRIRWSLLSRMPPATS